MASGIFDIAVTANPFIKNKAPLIEMSSLPWLITDAEAKDGKIRMMIKDTPDAAAREVVVQIPVLGAYSKTIETQIQNNLDALLAGGGKPAAKKARAKTGKKK